MLLDEISEESKNILLKELLIFASSINKINTHDEPIEQNLQKKGILNYNSKSIYCYTYFLRVNSWGNEIVNRIKNGSLESLPIEQYPLILYLSPFELEGQKKANLVFDRWKESICREVELQKNGVPFNVNSLHSLNAFVALYRILNTNCSCRCCAGFKNDATATGDKQ
jgi:hypothetical protein